MKRVNRIWNTASRYAFPPYDLPAQASDDDGDGLHVEYRDGSIERLPALPYGADRMGESSGLGENAFWDFRGEMFCPIRIDGRWGFVDDCLRLVCPPQFDFVGTERDIKQGGCHVPPNICHQAVWTKGFLPAVVGGKACHIDRDFAPTPCGEEYLGRVLSEPRVTPDSVIRISKELLPEARRRRPWQYVGHGVGLLSTEEEMNAYMAAYGEMHYMKCRAAFQNFPFGELPPGTEIADWGCGQGIAALAFLEALAERGLEGRVRRVILIEPSPHTLARAAANIRTALPQHPMTIVAVNKYLPSAAQETDTVSRDDLSFSGEATVNLFSNILDVAAVDLRRTASLLLATGKTHYVACMGPLNANSGRVDEFCRLLSPGEGYFSNITEREYAHTSDTHHLYGCLTRGFVLRGRAGSVPDDSVRQGEYTEDGCYGAYDRRALEREGGLPEGLAETYEALSSRLSDDDSIFLRPHLETDDPDIVIIRPRHGVLIVKVFGDRTEGLALTPDAVTDSHGNPIMESPIKTVLGYKKNLEEQHSGRIVRALVVDRSAYYMVKTAVCFPALDEGAAKDFCRPGYEGLNRSNQGCVAILGRDSFGSDLWETVGLDRPHRRFDKAMSDELLDLLATKWHSYKEGDRDVVLKGKPEELARSTAANRRKIKGVAGSGKTQILVERAANCQVRTGGRVLILTYNITLANYIRYRLSRVPKDFFWNKFTIGTYYNFFTSQARNHNLRIDIDTSYEDENFFERAAGRLPKYDAILIDEAQDYQSEWMSILQRYFLKPGGEFVVFGDTKQNIYDRPLDEQKLIRIPNVPGAWTTLKKCHRAGNARLVDLALAFQLRFMPDLQIDDIDRQTELDLGGTQFSYTELPASPSAEQLYETLKRTLSDTHARHDDTVVLASTCDILREMDYRCRQDGTATFTMCETKECYERIMADTPGEGIARSRIEKVRKNKKQHFTMKHDGLKMSTVHSFKGWEAETVVFLLQPTDTEIIFSDTEQTTHDKYIVYTAITRAKKNLAVINLGNQEYSAFFREALHG